MNVTGWSAFSLWTISLGLRMCSLLFTKIKMYLLKMKIVWFFLAAGDKTKECPSTYWAHAFELGENMRLFTKAPIHEANFYRYFTIGCFLIYTDVWSLYISLLVFLVILSNCLPLISCICILPEFVVFISPCTLIIFRLHDLPTMPKEHIFCYHLILH